MEGGQRWGGGLTIDNRLIKERVITIDNQRKKEGRITIDNQLIKEGGGEIMTYDKD